MLYPIELRALEKNLSRRRWYDHELLPDAIHRYHVGGWFCVSKIGLTFDQLTGIQRTRNNSEEAFSATPQISDTGKRKIPHEHLFTQLYRTRRD